MKLSVLTIVGNSWTNSKKHKISYFEIYQFLYATRISVREVIFEVYIARQNLQVK